MYLINWLRNLEQKLHARQFRRLRRRLNCEYTTIAAEIQTLESRRFLSAAVTAIPAQTSNTCTVSEQHSQLTLAGGNATATPTTSVNWSGYVATNNVANSVTQVKGSWTVPTVASSTGNTYSCAWVGIDGWLGNTVEQIGTEQDMVNGAPVYYAWWEMWSNGIQQPQQIFATVSPGDSVSAQVQYVTSGAHAGQFQLSFTDSTRSASNFTTYQTSSATQSPVAPRSQAEWIVEATMENGSIAPLANFGTVTFSNAQATIQGVTEPIGGPYSISPTVNLDQINMIQQGVTVDATSSLTAGQSGSSFSVTYLAQTQAPALSAPVVSATAQSTSSVSLAWNAVPGAQGYRVYEWNGSQNVLLQTLGSSATGAQISGLSAGTTYQFLVEAYSGSQTADSAWTSVTTLPQTPALAAPVASATAQSSSSVTLAWNAVPGAQGYRVYESNGSQNVLAQTLDSSATSAQISSLSAGTTYQFLVEAYRDSQTADSAWTSVTTQQVQAPPSGPAFILTGEYAVSTPGNNSLTLASIVQLAAQLSLNANDLSTSAIVSASAPQILAGNAVVATYANSVITFSSGTYAGQVWTKLDLPVDYTNQSGAAVQVLQSGTSITFVNKFGATTPAVWTSPTTLFLSAWNESVTTGVGALTFQDGSIWSENLALNGTNNGSSTTTITAAPSAVYVFDYVNGGNMPVHVVQTGTNQVVFIFANQVFGVGTFISATQLTTPACPNDIATISNDFTTITWQDGTVWTQGARTAAVNVLDMTNAAGVAVHLIQNGSNHVAFVDSLGRTTLGTMVSPGKVVSDLYGPNDVATISGNTVSWQDGSLWTQTNNVPLTITFTDTNGALTHVRLTSATTLVGLDGEMRGVTATRQNGQIVWSNGAAWNNFDLNALNALFEMGTGYP